MLMADTAEHLQGCLQRLHALLVPELLQECSKLDNACLSS